MNEGQMHEHVGDGAELLDVDPAVAGQDLEDHAAAEAAREAEQREFDAATLAAAQAQQDLYAYRMTLGVAGQAIEHVIVEAIAIATLLTWSPAREEEVQLRITAAAQNLARFKGVMDEVSAARRTLVASHQAVDPVEDRADHYSSTLDAFREVRRQLDGLIAVLGSDVCNTPALTATARAVSEAEYVASLRARGLSIFLERAGLAT